MKRSPLKKVSNNYSARLAIYRKLKKMHLETHTKCDRCGACGILELDHAAGRGKYLCDVRYFQVLCPRCHRWKHQYPKQAMEQGFTLNKFILDRNE